MKKIKIVGIIIPFIAILLVILSYFNIEHSLTNRDILNALNSQKAFTQDISKNIFFIYKNKDSSTHNLDEITKKFLKNKNINSIQNKKIAKLWNKFYKDVQQFKLHVHENNMYSNILKEILVKKIYDTNFKLVTQFDEEIAKIEKTFTANMMIYKYMEYILYALLILLLIYLASKLHEILEFIQKFLNTSKNIRQNSTIKGLKPIKVNQNDENLQQASENFNSLVKMINSSIEDSTLSLDHSYKSLEQVENNIENFMQLLHTMDTQDSDKNLSQKEDAVIDSLDEIMSASKKLKDLKRELKGLIIHK